MSAEQQMIACPSCGKRYALSDFKEDKLICSACGREIPRFISVGAVDEAKYVKQYLNRIFNFGERMVFLFFAPLFELLLLWLLTLDISFWWKILILFSAFGLPVWMFREFRKHLQVRRIFKSNNYQLQESVARFKCWYDSLSDDAKSDVPSCYKDSFVEDLENYVKSHAELKRDYGRTGEGRQSAEDIAQGAQPYRFVIPKEEQTCEVYDYPPERCPGCGKLYVVSDFSTDNVQCHSCGKLIRINCKISDEDMRELCVRLRKKIKKAKRSNQIILFILLLILTLVIYWQIKAVGVYRYFSSWHVLTMFFYSGLGLAPCLASEEKKLIYLLDQDDPDILAVEIYIKKLAGKNSRINDEEKAFAEFKKSLFDLYRVKGKVIGRY